MRFLILLLLLGTCFGIYKAYESKTLLNDAKKTLADAESRLAFSQEQLMTRKRDLQTLQTVADQARKQTAEVERLSQQKTELTSKLVEIQKELQAMRANVSAQLEVARAQATSTELPSLDLNSGKRLLNVTFRKLDDQQASLSHKDGMVTIPVDLLPQDVIERFGIGNSALLAELDEEIAKVGAFIEGKTVKAQSAGSLAKTLSPLGPDEQRLHGMVVHCPITLRSVPPALEEPSLVGINAYRAELPGGLVVAVQHLELKPGAESTLERMPDAAVANIMKLPGMHRSNHNRKEYTISGQPAWRSSFTALQQKATGVITVYMEAVYVRKASSIWTAQAIFTSETPGNRSQAERVINSVRLD